jgi:hypothetical protein
MAKTTRGIAYNERTRKKEKNQPPKEIKHR